MPYRKERLQEILRQEISRIIEREYSMPGVFTTVLGVKLSPDGKEARVFYSVYPETNREIMQKRFNGGRLHVRSFLKKNLAIHPIPVPTFILDTTEEEAARIERILIEEGAKNHASKPRRKLPKTA